MLSWGGGEHGTSFITLLSKKNNPQNLIQL